MRRFKRRRVISLKVALVDEILEALKNARIQPDLGGPRRHELGVAFEQLAEARARARGRVVSVTNNMLVHVLNCFAASQAWYQDMLRLYADHDSQR